MKSFLKIGQRLQIPALADATNDSSPNYKVVDLMAGGMGTCARIINDENTKSFALKTIHAELFLDQNAVNRYFEELKLSITLSASDGVAQALFILRINEIPCIISKWYANGNLKPWIQNSDKHFFYHTFDRLFETLKWALKKHNVIHRDLKPENILLNHQKDAFVADWGLAKILSESKIIPRMINNDINDEFAKTQQGVFMGSILYASPEQLLGEKTVDHRTDIYALGCMMFQFEMNIPPFTGRTIQEIFHKHLNNKPPRISGIFKKSKYGVEKIIAKCLAKNKQDRYGDYNELILDFVKIAKKQKGFKKFRNSDVYMPMIGQNALNERVQNIRAQTDKKYVIISNDEAEGYFKEAETLLALGEYAKALKIYHRFFDYQSSRNSIDNLKTQNIVINVAVCLRCLNKIDQALAVLDIFKTAKNKPLIYFLNKGDLLLYKKDYEGVIEVSKKGIKEFGTDKDLLGNCSLALLMSDKLFDALNYNKERLRLFRDLKGLSESGGINSAIGTKLFYSNYPKANYHYNQALQKFDEAISINPKDEETLFNKAHVLFKLRKFRNSISLCDQVIGFTKLKWAVTSCYALIAENLLWTSNFKESYNQSQLGLKVDQNDIQLKRIRAQSICDGFTQNIFSKEKLYSDECFGFFQSIIDDKQNVIAEDYDFLADICSRFGGDVEVQTAFKLLEEGSLRFKNYWKFDFIKSRIYNKYGYYEKALPFAINAVQKAPWEELAYENLIEVKNNLGKDTQSLHSELLDIKLHKEQLLNKTA